MAVSALGHLFGEEDTIPADRGLFLETTWCLHPDVCQFTSEAFYDGKLISESNLARQDVSLLKVSGPGLWLWPVKHS
jgi:uncharacterized protein